MSYGKMNIWLRDPYCVPKNVWKMELVIKTCQGANILDFNPDVLYQLRKRYCGWMIKKGMRADEKVISIKQPDYEESIKHIEVDVPPGCYIVRAWVCYGNLWTERVMSIVSCGDDACVNLIVPKAEHCIRMVIIPYAIEARAKAIPYDPAFLNSLELLAQAGGFTLQEIAEEIDRLIKELECADVEICGDLELQVLKDLYALLTTGPIP